MIINFKKMDDIHSAVRKHYSQVVSSQGNKCSTGSCFTYTSDPEYAAKLGYAKDDLDEITKDANLGLGCGNPAAFAGIKSGDTVLDLGSGAGFDAFIAAKKVGETGQVIGVDMTHEMLQKARNNAEKYGLKQVQFRLGEIEYLPVADCSVDLVLSNCVINLVPEANKLQVFREVFRVLKKGGRICISDVLTSAPIPEEMLQNLNLFAGCLSGATLLENMHTYLEEAGFLDIKISPKEESKEFIKTWSPHAKIADFIFSALIEAKKH